MFYPDPEPIGDTLLRKVAEEAGAGVRADRSRRYGRGKFEAHPAYIEYMERLVDSPPFSEIPNARDDDGHVNWQVSSGKTTSFNRYYQARWDWWAEVADQLGLPGTGNQEERFTIAARTINPTGYRPCRLCGEERNVGYFYANANLAKRLNRAVGRHEFERGESMAEVLRKVDQFVGRGDTEAIIRPLFPERSGAFAQHGCTAAAFEVTRTLRSSWLTPGYMGNPPDRLDGLHDYCLYCRAGNDPGRSDENLRSYQHDRRAFEWWAEGDWKLTDDLYNSAAAGECSVCGTSVDKVSPDHVGPLACGFKQVPLFVPTCVACNSSRNRRMRAADIGRLTAFEVSSGASVAGWQVRGLWDAWKRRISTDAEALELSNLMRALQDCYLRVLYGLLLDGRAGFLSSLLRPEFAFRDHEFEGLDPAHLTYRSVLMTKVNTPNRRSLAARSVRIAFDELGAYVAKPIEDRRLHQGIAVGCAGLLAECRAAIEALPALQDDEAWQTVVTSDASNDEREAGILTLLGRSDRGNGRDRRGCADLERLFYDFGAGVGADNSV